MLMCYALFHGAEGLAVVARLDRAQGQQHADTELPAAGGGI